MHVKITIGGDVITVLNVYAPQTGCSEEEKDEFWKNLDGVTMEIPDNERVIIGRDLNGHVGRQEEREVYKTAKKMAKRAEAMEEAYEELERRQDGRQLLRIARATDKTTKDITSMRQIKDELGVALHDLEKILSRWWEYFE
ncbi:uncharacterized protein LOC124805515 [Schistocerca piceifrons]|uniref:uncharacterized protein LOC124805515 n=1 Tax=Schistocerca piceifrons TaxID=274613 RepID=UPI001F5F1A13|nr:uncharacterized protein LOC124805515 [Schistocerca piceifrons]